MGEAHRRARGDGAAHRRSARAGRAAAPHRRLLRAAPRVAAGRVQGVRARAQGGLGERADARPSRAARRPDQGVGRAGGAVRAASWASCSRCRGRSTCCCASRACTRRSSGRPSSAIATYRRVARRRGGEPRRHPGARSALSADRALGRAGRHPAARDPPGAERRRRSWRCSSGSGSCTSRTCATSTAAIERLPRDPERRRRPRTDAGGARAPVRRGRQADRDRRDPRAALSHRRAVGEAGQDLRGPARQAHRRRRAHAADPAHRRDRTSRGSSISRPRSSGGRRRCARRRKSELAIEEVERLAEACHTWEDLVGIYAQVLEERGDDSETQRVVLSRLARVYEHELRDNARAEEALPAGARRSIRRDADALAALDRIYEAGGDVAGAGRHPRPAHRHHHGDRRDHRALLPPRPRASPRRSTTRPRRSRRTTRSSTTTRATGARSSRWSGSTSTREQWQELFDVYEKMVDIAPGDEGMADCYARMAKIAQDGARRPREGGRPVGPRHRPARRGSDRARRAGQPARARRAVARARRRARAARCASPHEPQEQIPLYQRLGRIWGEKLHRERNSLEAWQKVLEIDPTDVPALRALAAIYKSTQAWEELVETLHKLIDIGTAPGRDMDRDELIELYAELGALQGEILMRPQEAIDAWQRVLRARRSRLPRARGARAALHAGGALGGVHRRPRAEGEGARRPAGSRSRCCCRRRRCGRTRSATAIARRDVYERILQLDAQNLTASLAARAGLPRRRAAGRS